MVRTLDKPKSGDEPQEFQIDGAELAEAQEKVETEGPRVIQIDGANMSGYPNSVTCAAHMAWRLVSIHSITSDEAQRRIDAAVRAFNQAPQNQGKPDLTVEEIFALVGEEYKPPKTQTQREALTQLVRGRRCPDCGREQPLGAAVA